MSTHLLFSLIVSATLSGVEALKYPPFYGICFFDEIFSFFNLVRECLVSEFSHKVGISYW